MSLQQVYSSPSGQFGRRLPATATVQAADDLLRRRGPSTSDRIRLPYGESRLRAEVVSQSPRVVERACRTIGTGESAARREQTPVRRVAHLPPNGDATLGARVPASSS